MQCNRISYGIKSHAGSVHMRACLNDALMFHTGFLLEIIIDCTTQGLSPEERVHLTASLHTSSYTFLCGYGFGI